jgi:adenylate kinase
MQIIITGSPGVGKTSLARALGKRMKHKVVNEKRFAVEKGLGKWDVEADELVIPIQPFLAELKKLLEKEKKIILEGHLLCELKLPVDFIILLKCHPEVLESRLRARGYREEKIQDNVFCEGIDYCRKHVLRRYPRKNIIEVTNSGVKKTIKETMEHILGELKKRGSYE